MPFATTAHRVLAGAVATVVLLAMAVAGVIWHAGGAGATPPEKPAVADLSTSSTSSTSTSTTSTTSTTLKPKPVTSTAPPTTAVRRAVATTAPPATAAPAPTVPPVTQPRGAMASPEERCAAALKWVGQHGLALPAGWGFRCPAQALENGVPRWGVACSNCEGTGSWIAVDIGRIGTNDKALYYVVAHEICHAIDYETAGTSTELGADLCAALHGAPRPL